MAKISIIIPVYNTELYLEKCLQSVAEQTFTDFEVILVDDGSKDRSGEICDAFADKDKRFTVVHKENGGVAVARNFGLKHAKGQYVTFVDSDDILLPNYLSDMEVLLGPKTEIVFSDINGLESENIKDEELTSQLILKHPHILNGSPVNKIYLKSIIDEKEISFPIDISTMEDNIFVWRYLIECHTISISNKNNYGYNQHDGSLVRSVHQIEEIYRLCKTIMPVYEQIQKRLENSSIDMCDMYLYVACMKRLLISNCKGLSFGEVRDIISETTNVMKPVLNRISSRKDLSMVDFLLLKLLLNGITSSLAIITILNGCRGKVRD